MKHECVRTPLSRHRPRSGERPCHAGHCPGGGAGGGDVRSTAGEDLLHAAVHREALAVKKFLRSPRLVPLIIMTAWTSPWRSGRTGSIWARRTCRSPQPAPSSRIRCSSASPRSRWRTPSPRKGAAPITWAEPDLRDPHQDRRRRPVGACGVADHPPGGTHPACRHRRPQPTDSRRRGPVRGGRGRSGVGHHGRGRPGAGGPGTRAGHPVSEAHMGLRDIGEFGIIQRIRRGCLDAAGGRHPGHRR